MAHPIFVPALRATMGDWVYYISFMRMEDIRDRVSIAEEIHKSRRLRDFIQRQVTKRADDISEYLLNQKQRFFNAIVVGIYGGEPDWYQLDFRSNHLLQAEALPEYIEGALGILRLSGNEKMFAIDGQHRISGIRKALEDGDIGTLNDEEVCVIVVAHKTSQAGVQRTRRLFTTLNRYAKPVSTTEIIALDEDDIVAIVTRDVIDGNGLMSGENVSLKKTKALPPTDSTSVTSVVSLYKAHDVYLGRELNSRDWSRFKRQRPPEAAVVKCCKDVEELWTAFTRHFAPFRSLASGRRSRTVTQYRNRDGGHLLFRPVGLEAVVMAIVGAMRDDNLTLDQAIRRLAKLPMNLNGPPWVGLLWDDVGKKMLTREGRPALAMRLLLYLMGCKFYRQGSREDAIVALTKRYSASINRPVEETELPPPVIRE